MDNTTLLHLLLLFSGLFILGTTLCLALYKWDYRRYFSSSLWTKTAFWIPIFMLFLVLLYLKLWFSIGLFILIAGFAIHELSQHTRMQWYAIVYTLLIISAMAHLSLFFASTTELTATSAITIIAFGSVLSDVTAYFFGNFFGKFKLPSWINSGKSWDGVTGQIIGSVLGYILVLPIIDDFHHGLLLAVIIGVASAFGDIINSIVKRRLSIKDWGNTIPGHGGVLDRFSSLSLAIASGYWLLTLLT